MLERGLQPDFSAQALDELARITGPAQAADKSIRDLRTLLWCSIDNDDSRDLDQLSVADAHGSGSGSDVKLLVSVADVDALVSKGSPLDRHAAVNTTSVYTPAAIFPMLPERLSTDLTSLADQQDRLSIVIECVVSSDGRLTSALHTTTFYGQPLVSWTPALGAQAYEVQWSKTSYPFKPESFPGSTFKGSMETGTSAVLPVGPGTWYYRVRGYDYSLPTAVQQMSWSDPQKLVVAKPKFKIVTPPKTKFKVVGKTK